MSDIVSPGASEQQAQAEVAQYFKFLDDVTTPQARKDVFKKAKGIPICWQSSRQKRKL
ncbi:MAG: hypothetical protein ACLUKN_04950 [Bacilli bacterium]